MANKDIKAEVKKPAKADEKKVETAPVSKKEAKQERKWNSVPPSKRKCLCKNEFQDKKYGVGIRLHNRYKLGHRCTVCGTETMT